MIHGEVLGARLAGRDLQAASGPETFTLEGTEDFAERARQEAAAPPPITTSSEADTAAFEQKARAAAAPPHRHR